MRVLVLRCADCGVQGRFRGLDIDAILQAIDQAGWSDSLDSPWCAACWPAHDHDGVED